MPPIFTKYLSQTLSRQTKREIKEAEEYSPLQKGDIILARGGFHLQLEKSQHQLFYRSVQSPPVNNLRPCADILFSSAALTLQSRVMGIVLTGMGQDGLEGAHAIHHHGGSILLQDEESSVVWGMPSAIIKADIPATVASLTQIAGILEEIASIP